MRNIWTDGYTIVRDGKEITLTRAELNDINAAIRAENGRSSLDWYIECQEDNIQYGFDDVDRLNKKIAIAKEMYEDDRQAALVWDEFLDNVLEDSGEIEMDTVDWIINDELRREEEE